MALFGIGILMIRAGITWTHSSVRSQLAEQRLLDTKGQAIKATITRKRLEMLRSSGGGIGAIRTENTADEICHVSVIYGIPDRSGSFEKADEFRNDGACQRCRVGQVLSGRALADQPRRMLLDDNRLSTGGTGRGLA